MSKEQTKWAKTGIPNVVRNSSSKIYYLRAQLHGKEVWKSLKTNVATVAKQKALGELKDINEQRETAQALNSGILTVGQAMTAYSEKMQGDASIKPGTKHYYNQILTALKRSWPDIERLRVSNISNRDCEQWAATYAQNSSSTRFNNTVAMLKGIFELAIKHGARFGNPAKELKRKPVRGKVLELPTRAQFVQFVEEIAGAGAWCSKDCADFVRFLAFTGCRIGEASHVTWSDVDLEKGCLFVRGDPKTGTKNSESRMIPIIPALAEMLAGRTPEPDTPILRVREAQKAMNHAAKRVGMKRITHHDLRHFFATVCIESGVDIPTVSRWLGHKDGGALAMKTYGHLRNEHSLLAAQKVRF